MKMQYPSSEEVRSYTSEFDVANSEACHKGFTGSLVLRSEDGDGVVVYLEGLPVYAYARYEGESSEARGSEAVKTLSGRGGTIEKRPSDEESVRMFRTYMEYLGRDDNNVLVYEKEPVRVEERVFLATGDDGLTKAEVPAGRRVGYARTEKDVSRYFERESADGYSVSNNAVLRYGNGHLTEREEMKDDGEPLLARMDTEKGLTEIDCEFERVFPETGTSSRKIDVEFDIHGWEVVRTDLDEDERKGGLLGGLLR